MTEMTRSARVRLDRTEVEVMEEFELIVDVTPADVVLTEPVTLVVVGDPPAIEAQAFLNTGHAWVGSDFVLVVEAGAGEMDADPVLPDMSAFAEPPLATRSGGSSGGGRYTVSREYQIRAVAAGEFEVGPVQVMAAGETVLTEPLRLVISYAPPPTPVTSPKDLRATATADRHRVCVGEPVIVTHRVLSRDMRGFEWWWVEGNDTLVLPPHDNFQLQRLRSWGSRQRGMHSDTHRSWRLEADEAGEFVIPPVQVVAGDRTYESEPMTLIVEPPRLQVETTLESESIWVGGEFGFKLEVAGVSELDAEPTVPKTDAFAELPGVEEWSHDVCEGHMARLYSFRALQAGEFGVEMSWFQAETGSYGTTRSHPFTVTVVPAGPAAR